MNRIEQNDYRMKWMAENKGDEYFEMFGKLALQGYEIQNIIDGLWELFKPEDNTQANTTL